MLWDGGMERRLLGSEPKVRAGEPGWARGGTVPQAAGQGEGSREEKEVPRRCWHMG